MSTVATKFDQCTECELAVYCYCDPSEWVFRTQEEMETITKAIESCPVRERLIQRGKEKSV